MIEKSFPSKRSMPSPSRKLRNSHETFTSILKNIIKLKLDIPVVQFKKIGNLNTSCGKHTTKSSDVYERVKTGRDKCKEINTGENVMFNITFKCQDSQPRLITEEYHRIDKDQILYPEKVMPIDTLRIEICFNYRNSISELCNLTNYGSKNEEEIINSLITIIDHDDHQVYFKMKTNYFNEEMEQLFRYIVIGKMDNSQHAFIFDVSDFATKCKKGTIPKDLKHIYSMCMPKGLANHFENLKDGVSTNSDKSIRRVGFGMFFRADTLPDRYRTRWYYHRDNYQESSQMGVVTNGKRDGDYGMQIISETAAIDYLYYRGVIDVGYYQFKSVGWCRYESLFSANHYTHKLTQQVKKLP